jgi:hypothetical protein
MRLIKAVSLLTLLMLILAGCGAAGSTPTPIPAPTNTPAPLPTDTPMPLPTDTPAPTDEPGTPFPLPTGTPSANPYQTIAAMLQAIRNMPAGDEQQKAWEAYQAYVKALVGQNIDGWQGWVVRVGSANLGIGWWPDIETPVATNPNTVLIYMEDPYNPPKVTVQGVRGGGSPVPDGLYVVLTGLDDATFQQIKVGQEWQFSGEIANVDSNYSYGLLVNPSAAKMVADNAPRITPPAGLEDLVITLDRGPCFGFCPSYSVTVYGDGLVVFEGVRFTSVQGFAIGSVDAATLQQLVDAFNKAGFDAMQDRYDNMQVTDMPSATTSLTLNGKTHSVYHYFGDDNAPEALKQLEDQIDTLLKTEVWVK